MTAELPALDAPSLVELAVRRLRAEIVGGAFAPGERLVEEQLTRRFGVSRAPLREALRLLGQQGLVEHLPRRGVRVVALSAREYAVLHALMTRPQAILSRAQIEEKLYGWDDELGSNAVEVYVHGLRRKLGASFIRTVRGLGYTLGAGG